MRGEVEASHHKRVIHGSDSRMAIGLIGARYFFIPLRLTSYQVTQVSFPKDNDVSSRQHGAISIQILVLGWQKWLAKGVIRRLYPQLPFGLSSQHPKLTSL